MPPRASLPTTGCPEARNAIDLSILIVGSALADGFAGRLDALCRECAGDARIEIVVAGTGESLQGLPGRFPGVVLLALPAGTPIAAVRAAAVRRATGRYLATLTPTCRIRPGWLVALRSALLAHPVVGGAVEPAARGWTLRDWAAFWCEYGQYLPPLRGGAAFDLTGNNVAYCRQVLARTGALEQEGDSFWKAVAHRRLRAAQVELWAQPTVIVRHEGTVAFGGFLRRRFHHGRCYAAGRIADEPRRRWRSVVTAPLLPALFTGRLYASVWPKRRWRRALLLATPLLWALYLFWAAGELVGATLGGGDSCAHAI